MSLLTFLRGDRKPRPLAPEPEIVEDTFRPAAKTPAPADNIVFLEGGQHLVHFDSHSWSRRGIFWLREKLTKIPGDTTLVTVLIPWRAHEIMTLQHEGLWGSGPKTTKEAANSLYKGSKNLFIKKVVILESEKHAHEIEVNPAGSCTILIVTTTYLDDIGNREHCTAMRGKHSHCTWKAYKEILSKTFASRANFPAFKLTDEQLDAMLKGESLAEHAVTASLLELTIDELVTVH